MAKRESHNYDKINVRIEHDDMQKVKAYAKAHGMTTGAMIRAAIVNNIDFLSNPADADAAALAKLQKQNARLKSENARLKKKLAEASNDGTESADRRRTVTVMSSESYERLLDIYNKIVKPQAELKSSLSKLGGNINQRMQALNTAAKPFKNARAKKQAAYDKWLPEYQNAKQRVQPNYEAKCKKELDALSKDINTIDRELRKYTVEYDIASEVYDAVKQTADDIDSINKMMSEELKNALHEDKRH